VAANSVAVIDPKTNSLVRDDWVIWLTSYVKGQLWRVDPSLSSVTATIPVGRGALGLAADRDGIWVANSLDGTVTRVDPQTNKPVATIGLGHLPSWVAVGGRVWVSVQR